MCFVQLYVGFVFRAMFVRNILHKNEIPCTLFYEGQIVNVVADHYVNASLFQIITTINRKGSV